MGRTVESSSVEAVSWLSGGVTSAGSKTTRPSMDVDRMRDADGEAWVRPRGSTEPLGSVDVSERACPRCGQPRKRLAGRCSFCELEWGHPPSEGTGSSPVLDPPGSPLTLSEPPEGHEVLGPFALDRVPDRVPADALVRIDLKVWHSHSRSKLDDDLRALIIPHRWDGHVLSFLGAQLPQVVEQTRHIVEQVEPTLDGAQVVHLDVGDLSAGAIVRLRRTFDGAQLPFRMLSGDLEVSESDHDRVARILNDLRATDIASSEPPNLPSDETGDLGDDHAFAALDALYGAVDGLRRHPVSITAADHLADVCARCPVSSPYGLEPALWHDLVAEAGALATATSEREAAETRSRATTLYERLRAIVA